LSSEGFANLASGKLLDVPFLIYSFTIQDFFGLWKDADILMFPS